MSKKKDPPDPQDRSPDFTGHHDQVDLRRRAEGKAKDVDLYELDTLSREELRRMLHELRVYQVELTMQNDELRRTQAELDTSRTRYKDLYNSAPIGYCTISEEGLILEANRTISALLGVTRHDLVNRMFSRFIHEEDKDRYHSDRRYLLETSQARGCELRMTRTEGGPFWASLEMTVSQDQDGLPVNHVAVIDITRRKKAEEELKKYRDHLETLVKERTAELEAANTHLSEEIKVRQGVEAALRRAHDDLESRVQERTAELLDAFTKLEKEVAERERLEEELRHTQKMEALGRLAGGIAHDFNNILAAIIGFAELAYDKTKEGSKERRHLQRILDAGIRGRNLVRQMLAFSRKTEREKEPIQLSALVQDTLKLMRAALPATIGIISDIRSRWGMVLADPVQMEQTVMNLCANAAHAMREEGGVVLVELSEIMVSEDDPGPKGVGPGAYLKLSVSDTGSGISPEIVDKIFDPFFTTKKPGEGTGLGLSVVHGIVRQHHGHVTVESAPGKGSVFTVYLPKIEGQGLRKGDSLGHGLPQSGEQILLVEDEEGVAEAGRSILKRLGYHVTVRRNGTDALALFKSDPSKFDLIITDQTMPEMTGMELAAAFLAIRPGLPVILCTGYSDVVTEESALAAGIKAFVMKPLTRLELATTVRQVLDKK